LLKGGPHYSHLQEGFNRRLRRFPAHLPTLKLFSGCIASRITTVASGNGWLSPEQKGFLPGVHGTPEHTMLLECAIEEARSQKRKLIICWWDLANAFGSLPHAFLNQPLLSLPIPGALRNILCDIYRDNQFQFVVGK
jgi:hypothetical protein